MAKIKCEYCGTKFVRKQYGKTPKFCSRTCYWRKYYNDHREEINRKTCEYHMKNYSPHPLPRKYKSPEERRQAYIKMAHERYENNREYYKKKNHEWYINHKNEPEFKAMRARAARKYYRKMKGLRNEKSK